MKIILYGGKNRGYKTLETLLKLGQEVIAVFGLKLDVHEKDIYDSIESLTKDNNIPFYEQKDSKDADLIKKLDPDFILVVGWRTLLPKEIFDIPKKGAVAVHDSLLPKYRGFAPLNWSIICGEKNIGASMFYLEDDVDTGDIIDQQSFVVNIKDNIEKVTDNMVNTIISLVEKNIPLIEKDLIKPIKQDHSKATYCCKRTPDDGLIDWNRPSIELYNLIRALGKPYPGAFTFLEGKKLFIWEAEILEKPLLYSGNIPGRVVSVKDEGVMVLTSDYPLLIKTVQIDGSDILSAKDILKSIRLKLGK